MVTAMVYSPKIPPKTIAQTSRVRFVRLGIYCLKHRNPSKKLNKSVKICPRAAMTRAVRAIGVIVDISRVVFEGFADAWLRKQEKIDYDNCNGKMG